MATCSSWTGMLSTPGMTNPDPFYWYVVNPWYDKPGSFLYIILFILTLSVEHLFGWKGRRGEPGVHGEDNWVQMPCFNSWDWQVTTEERFRQQS